MAFVLFLKIDRLIVVDKNKQICTCTHIVIEVFPIGALARKSLAMGFTQRINTTTGDRKLMCSRILKETLQTSKRATYVLIYIACHAIKTLLTGWVGGLSSSVRHRDVSEPVAGRGRPGEIRYKHRQQPDRASRSVWSPGFWWQSKQPEVMMRAETFLGHIYSS